MTLELSVTSLRLMQRLKTQKAFYYSKMNMAVLKNGWSTITPKPKKNG